MAHDVLRFEADGDDVRNVGKHPHRLDKAGLLAGRQVDLRGIAGDDIRAFSPSRVRNIFICIDVVFCASSRMTQQLERVRPRMKASGATSMAPAASARSTFSAGIMS